MHKLFAQTLHMAIFLILSARIDVRSNKVSENTLWLRACSAFC